MVKVARSGGLLTTELPQITFKKWQQDLCSYWFATPIQFVEHIVRRKLEMPAGVLDSLEVRALAVFMKFGVASLDVPEHGFQNQKLCFWTLPLGFFSKTHSFR